MPKLAKQQAQAAEAAELREGDIGEPLPAGKYRAKLDEVKVKTGNDSGEPYWEWEFRLVDPEGQNRKAWVTTTLKDGSEWKLKEVFHALGWSTDSDTDEMIGEECILSLRIITQQQGANAGNKINSVSKCLPLDGSGEDDGEGPGNTGPKDASGF